MRLFILLILASLASNNALGSQTYWSEGPCKDDTKLYEGATRDYINRASFQEWNNRGGDWIDAFFTPNGQRYFSKLTIPPKAQKQTIMTDVSKLVFAWQSGSITNNGFFLKPENKTNAIVFSREHDSYINHPLLEIITPNGKEFLYPNADTEINTSTYRCLGDADQMSAQNVILLRFTIPKNLKILSANLILRGLNLSETAQKIKVYATNIEPNFEVREQGWSNKLTSQAMVKLSKQIILYEDFSSGWKNQWQNTYRGNVKTMTKNPNEHFIPISNEALQITIKKGEFTGSTVFADLTEHNLKKAYFRYYLRLGNSWEVYTSGKLPGFSGTYQDTSLAAGWGGRRSNGTNGWSARGSFGKTAGHSNTMSGKTPLGTYLYHSDMKTTFGDNIFWSKSHKHMIEKNKWYVIEQMVELNTPNNNNGKLAAWIDGYPVLEKNDVNFTNETRFHIERLWLNIYHGGKAPAPKDLVLFIDEVIVAKSYIGSPIRN